MKFKEAEHYKKLANKQVHCLLCPNSCMIENGGAGICEARQNMNGRLKSVIYARPYLINYSKIEKNSLYHFLPGEETLNISIAGSNLAGKFWEFEKIGQIQTINQTPAQIASQAKKTNSKIISFQGEPVISYEYIHDIAKNNKDIKHIITTSGFIEDAPIKEICKKIDACVFEIRGMSDEFYESVCKGKLSSTLKAIEFMYEKKKWFEIKMMLIPLIHKDFYDVRKLTSFILNNFGAEVPVHFLSFHPGKNTANYPSTDAEIIKKARRIAIEAGLSYVYTDNIDFPEGKTTYCPRCRKAVIFRGEKIENFLKKGKCKCGKEIAGVWH